jgi:hypothetical protein
MKYYLDTEFREDFTSPWFRKSRHFIELISIGIVAEDGREYYAISNEFDIDACWNKFQIETWMPENNVNPNIKCSQVYEKKVYWLRDNVLQPMIHELVMKSNGDQRNHVLNSIQGLGHLNALKWLIKKYGKSNKQIANEIPYFIFPSKEDIGEIDFGKYRELYHAPQFYGYYADYDWVLFCSLYGRMIDLPKGFPMYMRDLKHMLDDKASGLGYSFDTALSHIKTHERYPKQTNNHNALDDARWNKELHHFLQSI